MTLHSTSKHVTFVAAGMLAYGVVADQPAEATTITQGLFGTVVGGAFDGFTGSGSFSYDDSTFVGLENGPEAGDPVFYTPPGGITGFDIFDSLNLSFTIFNQTFTGGQDANFPFGATLGLTVDAGEATATADFLDFNIFEPGTPITAPGIAGFSFINEGGEFNPQAPGDFLVTINVEEAAIPLPAALPLYGTGLALLSFLRLAAAPQSQRDRLTFQIVPTIMAGTAVLPLRPFSFASHATIALR